MTDRLSRLALLALAATALALAPACGGSTTATSSERVAAAARPPTALTSATPPLDTALPDAPRVHAVLINGGHSEDANYLSHVEHVRGWLEVLEARGLPAERVVIFASDGRDEAPDLVVASPGERTSRWLLRGTGLARRLRPRAEPQNTVWEPHLAVQPASRLALSAWFERTADELGPGDLLLVYVTDHGTRGEPDVDDTALSLWGEKLDVAELREWLDAFDEGVQIALVMSQCFSGAFASAVLPADPLEPPTGDACGFFSVTADRPAYGCYAEGRARDDGLGHGYAFLDGLARHATLDESHRATALADITPDIPLRTSDVFLERLVERVAEDEHPEAPAAFVEGLLAESRERLSATDGGDGWGLVHELARAYGLAVPRTLAELELQLASIESLEDDLGDAADPWDTAADALSQANFEDFLTAEPAWRPRVARRALNTLDDDAREQLVDELVPALEAFTRQRGDAVFAHLEQMRTSTSLASAATWRQKVRIAVLERMRIVLLSLAGRQLLEREAAELAPQRAAFEALRGCERLSPGQLANASAAEPGPIEPLLAESIDDDRALLARLRPTLLGINYRQADGENPGVVLVQQIAAHSAAERAGLREGDLVFGPPGAPFFFRDDIRRWVLMAPVDEPLGLVIGRDGETRTLTLELTR